MTSKVEVEVKAKVKIKVSSILGNMYIYFHSKFQGPSLKNDLVMTILCFRPPKEVDFKAEVKIEVSSG